MQLRSSLIYICMLKNVWFRPFQSIFQVSSIIFARQPLIVAQWKSLASVRAHLSVYNILTLSIKFQMSWLLTNGSFSLLWTFMCAFCLPLSFKIVCPSSYGSVGMCVWNILMRVIQKCQRAMTINPRKHKKVHKSCTFARKIRDVVRAAGPRFCKWPGPNCCAWWQKKKVGYLHRSLSLSKQVGFFGPSTLLFRSFRGGSSCLLHFSICVPDCFRRINRSFVGLRFMDRLRFMEKSTAKRGSKWWEGRLQEEAQGLQIEGFCGSKIERVSLRQGAKSYLICKKLLRNVVWMHNMRVDTPCVTSPQRNAWSTQPGVSSQFCHLSKQNAIFTHCNPQNVSFVMIKSYLQANLFTSFLFELHKHFSRASGKELHLAQTSAARQFLLHPNFLTEKSGRHGHMRPVHAGTCREAPFNFILDSGTKTVHLNKGGTCVRSQLLRPADQPIVARFNWGQVPLDGPWIWCRGNIFFCHLVFEMEWTSDGLGLQDFKSSRWKQRTKCGTRGAHTRRSRLYFREWVCQHTS